MALTQKQIQELNIAQQRVDAGTASAVDRSNLEYAKKQGFNVGVQKVTSALGHPPQDQAEADVAREISAGTFQFPQNINYANPSQADVNSLQQPMQQAGQNVLDYSKPTQFLSFLKGALAMKTNPQNEQIGQSPLFQQAGLGNTMASLSESLQQRSSQLGNNVQNLTALLSSASGIYKDQYNQALTSYTMLKDEHDSLVARLQAINDQATQYDQQVKLLEKKAAIDKQTISISEQLAALQAGYKINDDGTLEAPLGDYSAEQIAAGIKQVESGGNYNARGGSGEFGAYQFMPATWAGWSKDYLSSIGQSANQSLAPTPENQDAVANFKISNWLQQGYDAKAIASMWNSGSPDPTGKVGTNKYGVKYDVPSYVSKVLKTLPQTSSTNNDAKNIALAIFSGTSSLKVTDYPVAQRKAIDAELVKLRQQALVTNDIYGIMSSSAGGKDADATTVISFEKAFNVIGQIADLQSTFESQGKLNDGTKVDLSPLTKIIRSNNPYDTKAQLIKAELQAIVPNLARGIYGEVGVLTDNDIKNYAQTLPNLGSTKDVANAVLGITIKSIQRSIENKVKVQAGLGRDVSGLADVYKQYDDISNQILQSVGGSGATQYSVVAPNGQTYTFADAEALAKFKQTTGIK